MNEHDKLFREIESIKENAMDLVEGTFPKNISSKLDIPTMTLDNTSYVDEKLQEYYSDLVYNCKLKSSGDVKITILFEHKSYKPANEYLQLLRYMLNIWTIQENNKEKLTLILPVIFYHGATKWERKYLLEYFDDIDDPDLQQFIPVIEYILTDITKYSDELINDQIFKREFNKALAILFKYIHNDVKLEGKLPEIFEHLNMYIEDEKINLLVVSFVSYIMELTEIEATIIQNIVSSKSIKGGEIVMTTAMKLRTEGKTEGKKEDARKMLAKKYSLDDISEITGLSIEEIRKLSK